MVVWWTYSTDSIISWAVWKPQSVRGSQQLQVCFTWWPVISFCTWLSPQTSPHSLLLPFLCQPALTYFHVFFWNNRLLFLILRMPFWLTVCEVDSGRALFQSSCLAEWQCWACWLESKGVFCLVSCLVTVTLFQSRATVCRGLFHLCSVSFIFLLTASLKGHWLHYQF